MGKKRMILGCLMGMISVTGGLAAEPSAFSIRTANLENGLTITVQVDLSQLRYDPANGGALTLPGCKTAPAGNWSVPVYPTEIILPAGLAVDKLSVVPTGGYLSQTGTTPLTKTTPPSEACRQAEEAQGLPGRVPSRLVTLGLPSYRHGVHVQPMTIAPIQYEPSTGRIWAASRLVVELTWKPSATGQQFVAPKKLEGEVKRVRDLLKQQALNGADLDQITACPEPGRRETSAQTSVLSETPPTYIPRTPTGMVEGVLVCPENLTKYYKLFVDDKTRSGHPWELITYEWVYAQPAYQQGAFTDEAARLRAFLTEAYRLYGATSVIFGGNPPYLPPVWDRARWGDVRSTTDPGSMFFGWNPPTPEPHRAFGYFTNLDHGDQTDLEVQGAMETVYVTLLNPADHEPPYTVREVTTLLHQTIPGFPRVGYAAYEIADALRLNAVLPAGVTLNFPLGITIGAPFLAEGSPQIMNVNRNIYGALRDARLRAVAQAHPELWGQEVVFGANGTFEWLSTMDHERELTAGWIPAPPAWGPVGIGLYHTKLRRYREPVDPERAARSFIMADGVGYIPEVWQGANMVFDYFYGCATGEIFSASRGWGVGPSIQPSGLIAIFGCQTNSYSSNSYWSTYGRWTFDPEGGPVVMVTDGFPGWAGGYHAGPAFKHESFLEGVSQRLPLGALGLASEYGRPGPVVPTPTWVNGQLAMIYGDPTVPFWRAAPELPQVNHPTLAQDQVAVTVRDAQGAVLPGALVALSKRRSDGTYAYYQRTETDANGIASFSPGNPNVLGPGVLAVEIDSYPAVPNHDFYPYHGAIALPGNRPPTMVPNLPSRLPRSTEDGAWVLFDAGELVDPDGDDVMVSWRWTDVRSGSPVERVETGRYLRGFLGVGQNQVIVTVSDGQANVNQALAVEVVDMTSSELLVTHPPIAALSFTVSVMNFQLQPVVGAAVQVFRYPSNGALALGLTLLTDENGLVRVTLPVAPETLGMGVLAVNVVKIPYTTYQGGLALPAGNTPPAARATGDTLFPIRGILNGHYVGWPSLSVEGYAWPDWMPTVDPDGDVVLNVTWRWTDYASGSPMARVTHDPMLYMHASLPLGPSAITLTVSDRVAQTTAVIMVTGVAGLDRFPPEVWSSSSVAIAPAQQWVTIPVTINTPQPPVGWTLDFRVNDPLHFLWQQGAIPPGVASWRVTGVSSNDPRTNPPVTCSLLSNNRIRVLTEPNENATRYYSVTLEATDLSGNIGQGVGYIVIQDQSPPILTARTPLFITTTNTWVPIPLRVVAPGSPSLDGALMWEGTDVDHPSLPDQGVPGTFQIMDVRAVEDVQDLATPTNSFRIVGTTLEVRAEMNTDGSGRKYLVTIRAQDFSGNWSASVTNIVHVIPAGGVVVQGKVMKYVEGGGQSTRFGAADGGLVEVGETGALVEIRLMDGTWVGRTVTTAGGVWQMYAPVRTSSNPGGFVPLSLQVPPYIWRASKGGQTVEYYYATPNGPVMIASSVGVTLGLKSLNAQATPPPKAILWSAMNHAPVAQAATPQRIAFTDHGTVVMQLSGLGSSDPDPQDLLSYEWSWTDASGAFHRRFGSVITDEFPLGNTVVTLVVSDGASQATTTATVTVLRVITQPVSTGAME